MDHGTPSLVYFDPRTPADFSLNDNDLSENTAFDAAAAKTRDPELEQNLKAFVSAFPHVHVCRTAGSVLNKIESIQSDRHGSPLTVVVHVSPEHERSEAIRTSQARSPSPRSLPAPATAPLHKSELCGIRFLHHIVTERSNHQIYNFVTLVVLFGSQEKPGLSLQPLTNRGRSAASGARFASYSQYFQAGAVDILQGPLSPERVQCLPAHALRTCNEFRAQYPDHPGPDTRRGSWPAQQGDAKQPYPYLRESMVSGLMDRICDPDYIEKPINTKAFRLSPDRESAIAVAIGTWGFSAHDFTDDELTYACFLMLKHTLAMPGLEKWQLADEPLLTFILACRRVYNSFVIYHNFRHACDVLQATFFFLLSLGVLPPYPAISGNVASTSSLPNGIAEESQTEPVKGSFSVQDSPSKTPLASIMRPFEAMTLIISAVGHDVGHPGVNNLFLVTLNAPLAQLYNDRSVLESFHCAAFSQILRRYWPKAFEDVALRKLMINAILATDMSVHSNYITDLDKLNKELEEKETLVADLADGKLTETRTLLCCLIIKCADISNVGRKFSVATEWAEILTDEFANQAKMESELDMASCLFGGPPVQNDIVKMGASQIGFINIYGLPLFKKVARALPAMQFAVDELEGNKATWERTMEDAKKRNVTSRDSSATNTPTDRTHSPHNFRRGSVIAQSQMRADPMVFGAHSSLQSPRGGTKRHSAGSTSQLSNPNLSPSRRASLGPTVIPSGMITPLSGSRRSSAGHAKMLLGTSKLAEFQGTPGITSSATDAARNLDGSAEAIGTPTAPAKSKSMAISGQGLSSDSAARALVKNPPDFVLKDPIMPHDNERPAPVSTDKRRHSSSGSVTRGRDKMPAATRVDTATTSPGPSQRSGASRQRRTRKFTLKFWRKSKSLDRSSDRPAS